VFAYVDDGYIKGKLSVVLQVLDDLKRVLKEDAGLELNISKTAILPKAITQQDIFDVVHGFITVTPSMIQLSGEVSLDSFCHDGSVGIGVPIGTDAFVNHFTVKTYRDIIKEVEKLDTIQDGFIHYNRCVLQQQHVDCKISDTLLKKGTKQHADVWDSSNRTWTHM
jgi:hypothetical protein